MTKEQDAPIKKLERAFATCAAAGVSFYGLDSTLHAIDTQLAPQRGLAITERPDLQAHLVAIDTAGAYIDSGGF